jgi:hypothetical protein
MFPDGSDGDPQYRRPLWMAGVVARYVFDAVAGIRIRRLRMGELPR